MNRRIRSLLFFFLLSNGIAAQQIDSIRAKEMRTLDSIYNKMLTKYVDRIEVSKLMRTGIDAALQTLDPYTTYMNAQEAEEFRIQLTGRFGGTGVVIAPLDNSIVINEVYKGFPIDRAGLKPGDILLEIDGTDLKGKHIYDVFPLLRGVPGSTVKIIADRPSTKQRITKYVEREEIKTSSIPYYGITGNNIGYIRILQVTDESAEEVKQAFSALKTKTPLKGLIIDLRDNTGGYLRQAIKLASFFIGKGNLAVTTKGIHVDTADYTMDDALDTNIPLAILTNGFTGSAAEVFSGIMQDYDRAIIVGQKTFGKGLVQVMYDMPYDAKLKLTTAYYYTPSGRCIQNKDYSQKKEGVVIDDSLKKVFKTKNGRSIHDHEGIIPDIKLETSPDAKIIEALTNFDNNLIFSYALKYCSEHPAIVLPANFKLSEEEYSRFVHYLKDKDYSYHTGTESKISDLKKTAVQEGYWTGVELHWKKLEAQMKIEKQKDLARFKTDIKKLLEEQIVQHYYYRWGRYENSVSKDAEIKKAAEILANNERYKKTLAMSR